MTRLQLSAPSVEPVTLSEAKAHLRVESDHEDLLILDLIKVARQELERQTGLCLIDQSWRLFLDQWPSCGSIDLPLRPVKEISEIRIFDHEGNPGVLAPSGYVLDAYGQMPKLHMQQMAIPSQKHNGIEIDIICGFGEIGSDVPDILRRAILVLAAHWFEFRGTYTPKDQPVSIPPLFDRLIASERLVRL